MTGLFVRSELIAKFTYLHVAAPRNANSTEAEILRIETLDQDLLVILFDRVPGKGEFPHGITLSPPGHQLSFVFGRTWDFSKQSPSVTQEWRNVLVPNYNAVAAVGDEAGSIIYTRNDNQPKGFDFKHNLLLPQDLAKDASQAVQGISADPPSALLGSQLIAGFPKLIIHDAPESYPTPTVNVPIARIGWTCQVWSEQLPDYPGTNALDGDTNSLWHTQWDPNIPDTSQDYEIDMRAIYSISGFTYLPRQDGSANGRIGNYQIYSW